MNFDYKKLLLMLSAPLFILGCDENAFYQYLKGYGVQVRGEDVTLADVKSFLKRETEIAALEAVDETVLEDLRTTENTCPTLKVTTPRGLSCMHCMQDGARAQAQAIATVLHRSCLKNIAINYLTDGTFSFDAELLYNHITKLTEDGRRLFVYFYLTNGATQRLWANTPINAFGTRIKPSEFRERILYDTTLQNKYRKLVRRLIPFIRYANVRGAVVSLIAGLEDNLDDEAFEKLYELAMDELPYDVYVSFGRNACAGCTSGSEDGVPDGVFSEIHTASQYFSTKDGVVTNDGREYTSAVAEVEGATVTLSALKAVRDAATTKNDTFILWSGRRQGITTESKSMLIHPDDREYDIPTLAERRELIKFLRGN